MLKNYFKIAWRNLVKNKVFSAINISGLALGMACSMLIFLWMQDEKGVDAFHTNSTVAALLIALLTVSFEAIKAALANPVKSLRAE